MRNLKDDDNHKYYIFSLIPTALFFIFSGTGIISSLIQLTEILLLSLATVAALLVYLFANIIAFVYEYYPHLRQKHKFGFFAHVKGKWVNLFKRKKE